MADLKEIKCRLLRETHFLSENHQDAFSSGFPTYHEQGRNKTGHCKTGEEPPPKREIAAPAETGNGDNSGKLGSNSKSESYSSDTLAARFPIIAEHIGFEDVLEVAA